ncbi:nuclear receptor subfamily 1 group I member 2 isoform X2 [Echinops telfairi]|uniref:Nuclear receptor subfamily 1 group I member 2 isoform X2 n=1 Tax=Echinops telfairi TaxID=9371 RepID=A0AC55DEN3_ECHTE|nr:nuclear receptor subfamily 1 group I member 2 isoform X2 [Echinops telfairi]
MSDAAVEQRRALIKRKKRGRAPPPPQGANDLTAEQWRMIRELMDAQLKTFDTTFSHFKNFRLPEVLSSSPGGLECVQEEEASKWRQIQGHLCPVRLSLHLRGDDGSVWNYKPPADSGGREIFSLLPHMADMSTFMFKGIINFAKVISYFRDLPIEDQISLLKGATFELCQLRFNTVFNAETGTWECGRLSYCLEDPADRPGVVQRGVVDQLQERFAIALKAYIECKRPQPAHRFLFLKIMAMLTELRSITAQQTQRLLHIQDIHPFATPLMCELFSITEG